MIYIVLLIGFILRLINLNQSYWLDEAISVLTVRNNSYISLLENFSPGDFHPPLYYFLLKFWDGIFGYSEIASRFPSVLFGLGIVFFVYLIGKRLFNSQIGLISALFLAVNPLAVYYSQEARMYSLTAFTVTAAVYFFLKRSWFWFILFYLLALYSDYLPWLLLPLFIFSSRKNHKWLLAHFLLFIFYLPWLPTLYLQLQGGLSGISSGWGELLGGTNWKNIFLVPVKFIIGRISLDNKTVYGVILASVGLFYGYLLAKVRQKFLWLWLLTPIILAIIISIKIPLLMYFRFLFVLPALMILLGAAVSSKRQILAILIISLACLTIFNLNPNFQRENWRQAVTYFRSDPGLVLMPSLAQSAPINYYNPNQIVEDKNNINLSDFRTVYLVRYVQEIFDPSDIDKRSLEINYFHRTGIRDFNGVVVWKYQN